MVKVIQNSWLGGQLDFEMMGRQDFQKYQKGASVLKNFNILRRGGITKRQGFDRILDLAALGISPDDRDSVRLVPFSYTKEHGFVLLFAPGVCYAVCTVEGRICRVFSVPYSGGDEYGRPFDTKEEILSFDYQQCGYKLYIASRYRRPSVISATADLLDAAIAGTTEQSPFTWTRFIPEVSGGIPFITSFEQSRIAPTTDTAGGIVTERYKASAVFDDKEGDACDEAYNTSIIEPIAISATGGTVTNGTPSAVSVSPAYTTTAETTGGGISGTQTSTTTIPAVASVQYVNRVAATCDGTAYYAPWVDSQVIKVNIKVNPRTVDDREVYPSEIRVYKKAFGTYGLIGTVKVKGAEQERISDAAISGLLPYKGRFSRSVAATYRQTSADEIYPKSHEQGFTYVPSTDWKNSSTPTDHGLALMGWHLTYTNSMTITPNKKVLVDSAWIRIHLGTSYRRFGVHSASDVGDVDRRSYRGRIDRPLAQTAFHVYNRCERIRLNLAYTYTLSGSEQVLEGTAVAFVDTTGYCRYSGGSMVRYITSEYSEVTGPYNTTEWTGDYIKFRQNYQSKMQQFISSITTAASGENLTIRLEDYFTPPTGARHWEVTSITITPVGLGANESNPNGTTPAGISEENLLNREGVLEFTGLTMYGSEEFTDTVSFEDRNITPDASITPLEKTDDALFDSPNTFPGVVALSQQRLIWASSKSKPETVWMSAIGDFSQYRAHEIGQPDDALDFAMPITQFANLNHLVEMKRLLAFNSACEWLIDSNSTSSGITASTIQARPQSYLGSNPRLKPQVCNNSVVFCERTGQGVRRFAYNIQDDGFAGADVSVLSSSIFERNNIVDWTYQQFPFSMLWCVLADGRLASLTLMDEQDIIAWATHEHGGGGKFLCVATSRAVSPSLEDIRSEDATFRARAYRLATHEEVFAVVEQDGKVWLERMRVRSDPEDTVYNSLCLDAMRVVTNAGAYPVYNQQDPLELPDGMMPAADGRTWILPHDFSHDGTTYKAGQAVDRTTAQTLLGEGLDFLYEGSLFESRMTSVYPIVGAGIGTGQFDIKDIVNVGLRLESSYGGKVSSARSDATAVPIRYADDLDNDKSMVIGAKVRLHDVDCANIKPFGANFRDGRVTVSQDDRWGFTLLSMETDYAVETEGGGR